MAKIIAGFVMLILIISGGVVSDVYVQKTLDEINVRTDEMLVYAESEDYPSLNENFNNFLEWWHSNRDTLELLYPHTEVNQLVGRIADIKGYLMTEDADSLKVSLLSLKEETTNVRNVLGFYFKNVF